tara:strand:+ start:184 stop:618 length:435 start_codon:yes stop_codon:yes gene_type:complete
MHLEIINKSNNPNPQYQTDASSGMDLMAYLEKPIKISPGEFKLIGTGIFLKIPMGYEAQVRPRSGLALKNGITVLNSPGTIDSDYRGEIGVILINHSKVDFEIKPGNRIAQLVFAKHEKVILKNVKKIDSSLRGKGGFGSTGTN